MSLTDLHIKEIQERLRQVVKKKNVKNFLRSLFLFIISLSMLILILIIAEAIGKFSSTIRTFLLVGFLSFTVFLFLIFVLIPLLKIFFLGKINYVKVAKEVGNYFDELKDNLANVLQISLDKTTSISQSLKHAAIENVYNRTKKLKLTESINFNSLQKIISVAGTSLFLLILLLMTVPSLRSSANRLISYDQEFVIPPEYTFEIKPGNISITKGGNLEIIISVVGEKPENILFLKKSTEDADYEQTKLIPDSIGNCSILLKNIKSSFEYYALGNKNESNHYYVKVINRPVIANLSVQIVPPKYSKLPKEEMRDNGNIITLPGSNVILKLTASKKLKNSKIIFSSGKVIPLKISRKQAEGKFRISRQDEYHVEIVDSLGFDNTNPIIYTIKLLKDEYPSIQIISPNKNENLPNDDRLPLAVKIYDDYGLSKLNLYYRLSSSQFNHVQNKYTLVSIPIIKNQKDQDVFYLWDLTELELATNDIVSYYLEVFDNDTFNGPKSTKTSIYTVRVPSLDELLNNADKSQQNVANKMMETLKEAETLKKELENINNELKQNKKQISWEEKNKIEKAMDKLQKLNNKIQDIKKQLSETQKDFKKNNLLSEKTLQKYLELQKLLDEMNSDELKKAMEKMQEALEKMMRSKVQQNLDNLTFNEEMMRKSIERTLKLLKRIQVEQKVDELIKRTEELAKQQEEIKEQTKNTKPTNKNDLSNLSKKQNNVTKDLKKLEDEVIKLKDTMKEFNDMPNDSLNEIQKKLQEQNNQQKSEQAKSEISKQLLEQAMQNQSQISQNMKNMNKMIKSLQQSLQQQSQMRTMNEMMKITKELIKLSKDQEQLRKETSGLQPSSEQLDTKAEKQFQQEKNLDRILKQMVNLSQKTFAITPEMGRALGKAKTDMNKSIGALQNRNSTIAAIHQNNSMEALNQAASLMNSAMQNMMNGGAGGGMMSLLQQMQKLSQQQMQLNQLTKMLNQGKLSMQQQAQLKRLAQEQALIQKSLAELNKEAKESGESKKLAANLDKLVLEMKEVVSNLRTKKVNDDLVHKQEHILSKMLDVQRSINERDFEERRISESGKKFNLSSPPELLPNNEENKNLIKQELLKAIDEGYLKDYEDLIRQYFNALEKSTDNN